jgi:Ring finger domain
MFDRLMRGFETALLFGSLPIPERQSMSDEQKFTPITRSGFIDLPRSENEVIFTETDMELLELASIYGQEAAQLSSTSIMDTIMNLSLLGAITRQMSEESNNKLILTPEMIRLARTEMKLWCRAPEISEVFMGDIIRYWKRSNQSFPTLETIVKNHLETKACFCLRQFPHADQKAFITHFLAEFGKTPTCRQTTASMEYYRIQRSWPSPQQLDDMIAQQERLLRDMNFEQKEKAATPTPNLHLLRAQPVEEKDAMCAICQEQINPKDLCYKLTPCNHLFHAQSDKCLGDCSITSWLEKNDKCPVCRQQILLQNSAPTS